MVSYFSQTMNQIKMFEIDPKLFVTCRLCLDNTGVYQIVPSVQKQIKFCYDFEVDPFDALPQLICRDCESTLRTYFEVKTSYVEKQKNLRERLQLQNVTSHSPAIPPEQATVTSTQVLKSERQSKNRKRIISFSGSSSDISDADCSVISKEKRKKSSKCTKDTLLNIFEQGYRKWFACRFCNHQYKYRSEILSHINTHSSMKQKYDNLIKRDCFVKLDKLDNKQNICKSEQYVVHSSDKITHSVHHFYYVIIRPKEYSNCIKHDQPSSVEDKECCYSEGSENEIILKGCKKRRRRILSNDTVVIEKGDFKDVSKVNASDTNVDECISIDDSDNESIKSSDVLSNAGSSNLSSSVNNSEYKTIHNIISLCFKRHVKRMESIDTIEEPSHITQPQPTKLDSLLKHKVLSIGKKMITSSAFSCTGILRYLEHQNLEIVWTPKMLKYDTKKSDCVRIMMKLKSRDENDGHECGWKILENSNQMDRSYKDYIVSSIENELNQNVEKTLSYDKSNTDSIGENHADITEGRAETNEDTVYPEKDIMLKKLLNENPVLNPKTLTKKPQAPKLSKNSKKRTQSKEDKSVSVDRQNGETEDNILWPVITATMSLAPVSDSKTPQTESNDLPTISNPVIAEQSDASTIPLTDKATMDSEEQEPVVANFPRIKVKPASQLMSNTALNIMEQQNNQQANMFVPSQNVYMPFQNNFNVNPIEKVPTPRYDTTGYQNENFNVTSQNLFETNSASSAPMSRKNCTQEYVVMHSVDLPHTKTTSPFGYLKRLLQINNIHLLSPDEIMSASFICLLKFKLVFQQETTSPVILCLALFNCKEKFCLKVKDVNDIEINISRLTPNWQWEILKVYSGDVVTKMLDNAQKISSEVHENTRKFVCYLNSIEFQKTL